jgi:antitoxin component of MazEF toxin-antitoxin module
MQKHLSRIGNSLGLVIERPILRMLGITQQTQLRVSHDGKRILIEPIRQSPPTVAPPVVSEPSEPCEPLEAIDVEQTARELYNLWGMEDAHIVALHPKVNVNVSRYLSWAETYSFQQPSAEDRATAQRLSACLDERRAGKAWPEAIAAALISFPR